jgi:phospholipase/carboxylesterase
VVSVRAPFAVENGNGWTIPGDEDSFNRGLDTLHEFITQLPATYPVDANRITLMGFSQGAAMCYSITLKEPSLTHATAALAGFVPPQARQWIAPNRLKDKPIFIAHGIQDPTVSVDEARTAHDLMQQCGAHVTYHESDSTHKLSSQAMRELKNWLVL